MQWRLCVHPPRQSTFLVELISWADWYRSAALLLKRQKFSPCNIALANEISLSWPIQFQNCHSQPLFLRLATFVAQEASIRKLASATAAGPIRYFIGLHQPTPIQPKRTMTSTGQAFLLGVINPPPEQRWHACRLRTSERTMHSLLWQ